MTREPEPFRHRRTTAPPGAELPSPPPRFPLPVPNVSEAAPHIGGATGEGTVIGMSEAALRRGRPLPEVVEPGAGLAELDRDLVARRVNGAFAQLFATTPDDLIGTPFPGWFLPAVRESLRRELRALVSGEADGFDERLAGLGPAGPFFADVTGRAITGGDGEVCLVLLARPVEFPVDAAPVRLAELDAKILEGLAAGEPTVRIAMRLYLSRQAVDYRIGAMLRRLEAPSRAALVSKAYACGVLCPSQWPPRVARHARED